MIHRVSSLQELTHLILGQEEPVLRDLLVRPTPELEREAKRCGVDLDQFCSPVRLDGTWHAGHSSGTWCTELADAVPVEHIVHHYVLMCGETASQVDAVELRDLLDGRRALLVVEGDEFAAFAVVAFERCERSVRDLVVQRLEVAADDVEVRG